VPFGSCRDDGAVMRVRAAVLGALVWCAVVVAVSSLVWVVISRAGAGVVPVTQPQADVTGSLSVPDGGHASARASGRPSPGVTLSPRLSPSPSSDLTTPSAPTSTPVVPPPTSSSTPPPVPAAQRRSWSGPAGHVVAECRGTAVHLVAAYPNAGWRYLIGSRGPGLVQVRFVRVGDDGHTVTVRARCVSGVPDFTLPPHEPGDR
jgi:hypothetical protein